MTKRQTPPGRMSNALVVVVKPFGPHHCARCLGSVQAEKTSSRGASNSRVPMIERGSRSRSRLLVAGMFSIFPLRSSIVALLGALFGLQLLQVSVQPIEALVEKAAVVREPVVDVFERARLNAARPPLRFAAPRNQAS